MNVSIDRQRLFDEMWTTPMLHLAPKYGMSGPALRKVCVQLGVPVPQRGHWARLAAGHEMLRPPLPRLDMEKDDALSSTKRLAAKAPVDREAVEAGVTASTAEQWSSALRPSTFHPLVRNLVVAYEKAGAEALQMKARHDWETGHPGKKYRGAVPQFGEWTYFADAGQMLLKTHRRSVLRVSLGTYRRALTILDAVVRGLELRGYDVELEGGSERLRGTRSEVHISIRLSERLEQGFRIDNESWRAEPGNVKTFQPTGRLTLAIKQMGWGEVLICDRQQGRLEEEWDIVWATMERQHQRSLVTRQRWIDEKTEREESERIERERRLAAERAMRLAEEEEERRAALISEARDWETARLLRSYLAHLDLRDTGCAVPGDALAWRAWAMSVADEIDPSMGGAPGLAPSALGDPPLD